MSIIKKLPSVINTHFDVLTMITKSVKSSNLFIYTFCVCLLLCTFWAFFDPTFRPTFVEIFKSLVSVIVQALVTKI